MSEKINHNAAETEEPKSFIRPHPADRRGSQFQIFHNGRWIGQTNNTELTKLREQGLTDDQIVEKFAIDHTKAVEEHSRKFWQDVADDPESLYREDPLAGDVDPTGGYYEESQHPHDAHMDQVHKQHGN